jgi:hypothetical protein
MKTRNINLLSLNLSFTVSAKDSNRSSDAASLRATQEIPVNLWNLHVHYSTRKILSLIPIQSQINAVSHIRLNITNHLRQ